MQSLNQDQKRIDLDERIIEAIYKDYILCEKSLAHYFKAAWKVIEPKTVLKWNWHFDYMAEHLEAVELGQILRLMITLPPRGSKSNLVSVAYPTWSWLKNPERRFLSASYSASLSTMHSVARRTLIDSPWYQRGFGTRFKLADDQNTKNEFMNDKRGHMIATSITGTVIGKGCNRLLIDDPISPKEADSDIERETTNSTFDSTFMTRLDDKKKDAVIIVMQRLHEDDLIGHVKEKDSWIHIDLPAEAQEHQRLIFPLSGRIFDRAPGDLLHEAREGRIELDRMRKALGTRGYSAQYLQRPTAADGNIVRRDWLQFYDSMPPEFDEKGIFADLAYKDGEENDFTVIECWGRIGPNIYLIDQIREHMSFPRQMSAFREMVARHPDCICKEIEEKANGAALIQMVKDEIPGVVANNPKTSKGARLAAVSPLFEANNVFYPNPAIHPWVEINIHELLSMSLAGSKSKHDDTVDVASMAVFRLGRTAASIERLDALNRW